MKIKLINRLAKASLRFTALMVLMIIPVIGIITKLLRKRTN